MSDGRTILFSSDIDNPDEWNAMVQSRRPDLRVVDWRAIDDPDAVQFAMMFIPPEHGLQRYRNLRAVQSLGAGINQLDLATFPAHLPLARLVDESLTDTMVDYTLAAVFRHFRKLDVFARETAAARWSFEQARERRDYPVGVLGLGVLGSAIANALVGVGFPVTGWSRSPRDLPGVDVFSGPATFDAFLGSALAFVNVLPLTADTRDILNAKTFAKMRPGSVVINIGRGPHVVDQDLVAAIRSGHLAGATLDVFRTEPLPSDHVFFSVPQILVTPHVAGAISPQSAVKQVLENYDRAMSGQPLLNAVDKSRGY